MPPRLPFVLTCHDLVANATDYMEGALPWRARLAVWRHLLICHMCRAYLAQLRATTALLRGRALPPPPPDAVAAIVARAKEPG